MNIRPLLLAGTLCSAVSVHAQVNIGAFMNAHNSAGAARVLPTYLGDHFSNFQITLLNPYVSLGSSFATVDDAREYLTSETLGKDLIGRAVNKLDPEGNNIAGVVDLSVLAASFNIKGRDGRKLASIGVGIDEHVAVNATFNRELLELAYGGNKQYAGQTINIAPRFNGLAYTQYSVSTAASFTVPGSDFIIKPALRLSYLSGQAGVHMKDDNAITLYTEQQGRYLDFGFNYNIDVSAGADSVSLSGNSFTVNDKSFSSGAGSGVGIDFGVRVSPMQGLSFNIGVVDVGSINFTKHVTNIYNYSGKHYEGEPITFTENQSVRLDSLAGIADPSYSHNEFRVALPAKFLLSGLLGLGRMESKRISYYRHQLYVLYVQGFDDYLSSSKRAYVAAGYTHSIRDGLNIGVNAGIGGLTGGTFGVLASVKAGAFRFGINSNNVIPLLSPGSGRSADLGVLLGLSF